MKKNKLFLLGLFVVFAAVLSLSLVSNTFAKYVSTDQGFDSARVAKWGVTVTAFDEQFAESYDGTVATSNENKVVAPGTSKEVAGIVIAGKPEVSVKVEATADLVLSGWTVDGGAFYCPLTFEVAGNPVNLDGCDTAAKVEAAVETAIINALKIDSAAPNTTLDKTVNVRWTWAFEVDDVKDTYLGNQAAQGNAPIITLSISCTVTQID